MKEFFYTKEEMDEKFFEVNKKISDLTDHVDNLASLSLRNEQETIVLGHRVDKHEKWIGRAATSTGIEFFQ